MSNEPLYTENLNLLKAQDRWGTEDELTKMNGNWDVIDSTLADKAKKNDFVYLDDYSNLVSSNDWSTALQTALDTQKPVILGYKKTYQVSKTIHTNFNQLILGNFSTIKALTGTYDNVILYGTGQPIANTPVLLDIHCLNGGTIENLTLDCNHITNLIGMSAVEEDGINYYPINYYKNISIKDCNWGIYGQVQSTVHAGGFTGSIFDNLYISGTNGVFLGSNQDDVTFNGARIKATGVCIEKGGYNVVFNTPYLALNSDTAIGVKVDSAARSVVFNSLFIESVDKTNFLNQIPVYLNGTSAYPVRNTIINGLSINISGSNNNPLIYSLGTRNEITVNGLTQISPVTKIIGYYHGGNTSNYSTAKISIDTTFAMSMVFHETIPDTKNLLTKTVLECYDGKHTVYGQYEVDDEGLAYYLSGVTSGGKYYPSACDTNGMHVTVSVDTPFNLGNPSGYTLSGRNRITIRNASTSAGNLKISEFNGSVVGAQSGVSLILKPGEIAIFKKNTTTDMWEYIFNNAISSYSASFTANTKASGHLVMYGGVVYLAKDASFVTIG